MEKIDTARGECRISNGELKIEENPINPFENLIDAGLLVLVFPIVTHTLVSNWVSNTWTVWTIDLVLIAIVYALVYRQLKGGPTAIPLEKIEYVRIAQRSDHISIPDLTQLVTAYYFKNRDIVVYYSENGKKKKRRISLHTPSNRSSDTAELDGVKSFFESKGIEVI
jgi:hypothetical protein